MNSTYNVIPTPKLLRSVGDEVLRVSDIRVVGKVAPVIDSALNILAKECGITLVASESADVTVYSDEADFPEGCFDGELLELSKEKYAREQGYALIKRSGLGTVILAKTPIGAAYGLMTLRQLIGKPVGDVTVLDAPDFLGRGIKWLVWAETGAWSYDYGDGVEAIKKRMIRKLDTLMKYKISSVHADSFGFDTERFEGYTDIMRTLSDEARKRGIRITVGGYAMSYGMVGHLNSYQGKHFFNRKSYPDGEIYECIGTFDNRKATAVRAADRGTCLSNEALFNLKLEEMTEFLRKTHVTSLSLHNMDAEEVHEPMWLNRCPECRRRWPNDSLFAKDGCAGAFAEFIDKMMRELRKVKDGDYDAERDLVMRMAAPGYLYSHSTDEDFERGIEFWGCVSDYLEDPRGVGIGFREQFFYHGKDTPRAPLPARRINRASSSAGNFSGSDGFYDDKLFTTTSALDYILKGYDGMTTYNGNAFQEPLAVYNAEYMWNSENSGFYNVSPRPKNYKEFLELYHDLMKWRVKPAEVFGDGGFIDVICEKLYGEELGPIMSRVYKASGENGEPPILVAASVDIYTNYTKVVYPMRWDDEITPEREEELRTRFRECRAATRVAHEALEEAKKIAKGEIKEDIDFFAECSYMGMLLTDALTEYMNIFVLLADDFRSGRVPDADTAERLGILRERIAEYSKYVNTLPVKPLDKFNGPYIRRRELGEWLEYNTDLMQKSIAENKRIPTDRKPLPTRDWW